MSLNEEEFFMTLAADEAERGVLLGHGGPFGAIVVDAGGEVVGTGHNTVVFANDPTCHAEVNAIRDAARKMENWNLEGCELYTSCEPCPMCLSAAMWAGIRKVHYGATSADAANAGFGDGRMYDHIRSRGQEGIPLIQEQVGRRRCLRAFVRWRAKTDRVQY